MKDSSRAAYGLVSEEQRKTLDGVVLMIGDFTGMFPELEKNAAGALPGFFSYIVQNAKRHGPELDEYVRSALIPSVRGAAWMGLVMGALEKDRLDEVQVGAVEGYVGALRDFRLLEEYAGGLGMYGKQTGKGAALSKAMIQALSAAKTGAFDSLDQRLPEGFRDYSAKLMRSEGLEIAVLLGESISSAYGNAPSAEKLAASAQGLPERLRSAAKEYHETEPEFLRPGVDDALEAWNTAVRFYLLRNPGGGGAGGGPQASPGGILIAKN